MELEFGSLCHFPERVLIGSSNLIMQVDSTIKSRLGSLNLISRSWFLWIFYVSISSTNYSKAKLEYLRNKRGLSPFMDLITLYQGVI